MTAAQLQDVTIEYESIGDGAPLLLIMGLASQLIHWPDDFVEQLADRGFRVVRYDNRDIGLSTKMDTPPPGRARTVGSLVSRKAAKAPYLLADMASDAAGLLAHLGIDQAHVVGVSMGGMIAQSLTIAHPGRVASLTSIMSNTGSRRHGKPSVALMRRLPKHLNSTPETRIDDGLAISKLVSGPHFDLDEAREMLLRGIARNDDQAGTLRQIAAIAASPDRTRDLASVTAPTLVIHGLADRLVRPSGGTATARAIPGSRLLMFPDMAHDLPQNRWPEIIDAIVANTERAATLSATSVAS